MISGQTFDGFAPGFGDSASGIWNVGLLPNGKVLAMGGFSQVNGGTRPGFASLHPDGSLDEVLGALVLEPFGQFSTGINTVAVQRDGKLLVGGTFTKIAGESRGALARLLPNGSVDSSFTTPANTFHSLAVIRLTSNGGIILNGLRRLLPTGADDQSFVSALNSNSTVRCVVIQPDQSIIVVGSLLLKNGSSAAVVKLTANGSLDEDFQIVSGTGFNGCAVQPDGKILVWGSFSSLGGGTQRNLARLESNGSLDASFTPQVSATVIGLQLQTDGKMVISGSFQSVGNQSYRYLARLTEQGVVDPEFQSLNISGGHNISGLFLQPDGQILVSGSFSLPSGGGRFRRVTNPTPAVEELTADAGAIMWLRSGSAPEITSAVFQVWDGSGWSSDIPAVRIAGGWRATGVSLPASGWIRASGMRDGGAYNSNSSIIEKTVSFGGMRAAQLSIQQPVGSALAHQSVVDFGEHSATSGDQRRTFRITNTSSVPILGLRAWFTSQDGAFSLETAVPQRLDPSQFSDFVVRFSNATGGESMAGLQIEFDSPEQSTFAVRLRGVRIQHSLSFPETIGSVSTSAQQPDGKILLGGDFTQVAGVAKSRIARLMVTGEVDPDFVASANGRVSCFTVLADRNILVGGNFTQINGRPAPYFAMLNERGELVHPFGPTLNGDVRALAVDGTGRILLGGAFTQVNGVNRRHLVRLFSNGTVDESIVMTPNAAVRAILVDSTQGFYCGGDFSWVGSLARTALAYFAANGTPSSFDAGFVGGEVHSLASSSEGSVWVGGTIYKGTLINSWGLFRIGASDPPQFSRVVRSIAAVAGGGCVVAGDFTTVGGRRQPQLVRILANGTVDPTFRPSPNGNLQGVTVLNNGSVLAMGSFTAMAGRPCANLAMVPPSLPVSAPSLTGNGSEFLWGVPNGNPDFSFVQLERWNGSNWQFSGNCTKQANGWRSPWTSAPSSGWVRMLGRVAGGSLREQRLGYGSNAGAPRLEIRNAQGVVVPTGGVVDFGQEFWHSASAERQFTVKNIGGSILSGLSIESTSAHSGDFLVVEGPASTLLPGAETVVKLIFLPNRLGPCSALFRFRFNDPVQLPHEMLLTGFGYKARASFAPDPNGRVLASVELGNARLMVGGDFTSFKGVSAAYLARLLPNGELDRTFTGHTNGPVNAMQPLPNGRFMIGGNFTRLGGLVRQSLAILRSDGEAELGIAVDVVGAVNALALQQDGRVLVGGTFTLLAGQARTRLGRLTAEGMLDYGFNPTFDNQVSALAVQSDGKILVGGLFNMVNGQSAPILVRLLPDGTRDSTFSPAVQNGSVSSIQILDDDRILIGGSFGRVGGQNRPFVARLMPDGTVDGDFSVTPNAAVLTILKNAAGVVYLGGQFTSINGSAHLRLARLMPTGALDSLYNPEADGIVHHLAGLSSGDLIVGGAFSRIGGLPLARIAQLQVDSRPWLRLFALNQTFNGTLRPVSHQVFPPGLQVEVTYNGSLIPPTNAGVYQVTARVKSHAYLAEENELLVVQKRSQVVHFTRPIVHYANENTGLFAIGGGSGNRISFSVVEGPGIIEFSDRLSFSAAGVVLVAADQAGDINHHPASRVVRQIEVQPATATVELTDLRQPFDRWPKSAQAVTTPIGLNVQMRYNGSADVPVNPGLYSVLATVDDPRYEPATATGVLEIDHRNAVSLETGSEVADNPVTEEALWTNESAGSYNGLLVDSGNRRTVHGAIENLTIRSGRANSSPAFSGVLRFPDWKLPFRGVLSQASGLELTIWRKGKAFLIQLQLEYSEDNHAYLRGSVSWDGGRADCSAIRSSFHSSRKPVSSDWIGRFTFLMPSGNGHDVELPAGDGWAVGTLSRAGSILLTGMLPDGLRWTESARLSDDLSFDVYRPLYVTKLAAGFVGGRVALHESPGVSDAAAVLHWRKPESPRTARYPNGFEVYQDLIGARYLRPPTRQAAIFEWGAGAANPNVDMVIFTPLPGFGNGGALRFPAFWSNSNQVVGGSGFRLSAKLNRQNGLFTGRYQGAKPWASVSVQGVFFAEQERVAGLFLLPEITGAMRLQAIPE